MKKIIFTGTAILIFVFSAIVFADSTEVKNKTEVQQQQGNSNIIDFGNNTGSVNLPNTSRMDSNFNTPLQAYLNEGWKVYFPPHWGYYDKDGKALSQKELSIKQICGLGDKSSSIDRKTKFWIPFKNKNGSVTMLSRPPYPKADIFEIGYILVTSKKPLLIRESLANEAICIAWEDAYIRNAFVLVRAINVTNGKVLSIGGSIVGGSANNVQADPHRVVLAAAGGSGIGVSESWLHQGYEVKLVSYNKISDEPINQQSNVPAELKTSRLDLPEIYFDTDEYAVEDKLNEAEIENQFKNLDKIAQKIAGIWSELMNSRDVIRFIGSADERSSKIPNPRLGLLRGKDVAVKVGKRLVEKHNIGLRDVVNKLKYASVGKDFPVSSQYGHNRVVFVERATQISKNNRK